MNKKKVKKVEVRSFNPTVNLIFNVVIALFAISCILPFFFVIVISLTSETSLAENGYRFWPGEFSTAAYTYLFSGQMSSKIFQAFGVTVFVTVFGTLINATMTSLYALRHFSFQFSVSSFLHLGGIDYDAVFTGNGCELLGND